MHYPEQGTGPLVVLVHGFPDMRGYRQTEVPPEIA